MPIHKIKLAPDAEISIAPVSIQRLTRIFATPYKVPRPVRTGNDKMFESDEACIRGYKVRPADKRKGDPNFAEQTQDWENQKQYDEACLRIGAGRYTFQKDHAEAYTIEQALLAPWFAAENFQPLKDSVDWTERGAEIVDLLREQGMEWAGTELWAAVSAFNLLSGGTNEEEVAATVASFRSASGRAAATEAVRKADAPDGGSWAATGGADEQFIHDGSGGNKGRSKRK